MASIVRLDGRTRQEKRQQDGCQLPDGRLLGSNRGALQRFVSRLRTGVLGSPPEKCAEVICRVIRDIKKHVERWTAQTGEQTQVGVNETNLKD